MPARIMAETPAFVVLTMISAGRKALTVIIYPAPLRDLLLRVGRTGLVRARCSEAIVDE
jgi:hypothetical protein